MKITKRQLRRIIKEEYSKIVRKVPIIESKGDQYLRTMDMGLGYEDAMSLNDSPQVEAAARAIIAYRMGMEDIASAPDRVISDMFASSQMDDVHDLVMQATGGEGYDGRDVDSIRGFMIGLLDAYDLNY